MCSVAILPLLTYDCLLWESIYDKTKIFQVVTGNHQKYFTGIKAGTSADYTAEFKETEGSIKSTVSGYIYLPSH